MLSALGVVLLYIGSLVEALDLSAAVLASLACIIAVIEYGKGAPWAVYGVTSVLSLILLPVKTPAAFYAIFFGFYPILKEKIERRPRLLQWNALHPRLVSRYAGQCLRRRRQNLSPLPVLRRHRHGRSVS